MLMTLATLTLVGLTVVFAVVVGACFAVRAVKNQK